MHRVIQDRLEEVLDSVRAGKLSGELTVHLDQCAECRREIESMDQQARLLRRLRPQAEAEPRAGFYARVLERIELQGPVSVWNLFFDSMFGRRIAFASLALMLLLGVYLVSTEQSSDLAPIVAQDTMDLFPGPVMPVMADEDQPSVMLTGAQDSMLVNLVTFADVPVQEQ